MHDLRKFNIAQMRLIKLVERRDKFGEFRSIEEMLELDGFGIRILEKFCDSIIQADIIEAEGISQESILNQKTPKKDSYVTPALLEIVRNQINTIVSFHIDLNYFAWSKIRYLPNETVTGMFSVEEWHVDELVQFDKKPNLSSMSSLLVHLIDHIPEADAYVIEAMPMVNTNQGGAAQIVVNIQKAQFYAMLCALMSARKSIKIPGDETKIKHFDNVYFLRSFLSSRFYKYLIGNEKVATEQVVDMIFQYNSVFGHVQQMPKLDSVDISKNFKDYFQSSRPVEREYLGNALLVGLTFMKLCIQKCPKCIGALKTRNSP